MDETFTHEADEHGQSTDHESNGVIHTFSNTGYVLPAYLTPPSLAGERLVVFSVDNALCVDRLGHPAEAINFGIYGFDLICNPGKYFSYSRKQHFTFELATFDAELGGYR